MAKPENSDGSFDLERFRKLLQLMEKYGVTEANLQRDGEAWKVRRGPKQVAISPEVSFAAPTAAPMSAAPAPAAPAPVETAAAAVPASAGKTINAPTVGTFYTAPTPDDPDFVSVGTEVKPDTVVCIIEAMKVFNQIPAELSGKIVEVLVQNGDAVDFGQPLFRVE